MAQKVEESKPTQFHKLLKTLDDRGTLVCMYTQNIDGLELKAGLSMYHRTHPQDDLHGARCIPLHGDLQHLYCQSCHAVEIMKPHRDKLMSGRFPLCSACHRRQEARRESGRRMQSVPTMVPDIVLYEQEHPDAEHIAEFQRQDLSGAQPMDLLLVVGTGMHVVGTRRLIRAFAQHIRQHCPPHDSLPQVIYLNLDFKQQKKWESTFDLWVQADCQLVTDIMLNEMKEEENTKATIYPSDLLQPMECEQYSEDPNAVETEQVL
ncbi:DHS-like NAD/FAD-binding domain-containing protein [Butyriboletus roseoflavus]|nr:DHS-like NAD/FAD-binding domain-containing protein [Butyriboletus roseoflavus]